MSQKLEGISCAVCHAYLFPEDDVVYCPECGAPHHRDCYSSVGHCALDEFHGTERQYDKIKEAQITASRDEIKAQESSESYGNDRINCNMCNEKYDKNRNSCPKCGSPNLSKMGGGFAGFDFLGGVPADYDLGDGVTADQAKRFVAANTPRYIPKFASLNKSNRTSWNWMAFFFPCGWMLSRKMFKNGIVAGLLTVVATLLTLPFNNAIYNLGLMEAQGYAEIIANVSENLPEIGTAVIAVALIGTVLNLVIRIVSAIFGDYLYKSYVVESIKNINAESDDAEYDYRKKGGVNLFLFVIGVMAVENIPLIISMFV